jgi:hypothetical protein
VFTARYALSPYIKQTRFVFKGLNASITHTGTRTAVETMLRVYIFCTFWIFSICPLFLQTDTIHLSKRMQLSTDLH